MINPRCILPALLFLLPVSVLAQGTPPDGHTVQGLDHPESVAVAPDGEMFYAANIGAKLAPTAKDGDGSIARIAPDGSVVDAQFLPGSDDATLHAPKGTVVIENRLYTADIDRVVGFNLDDQSMVTEVSLADQGVSFLNDITVMDEETLLASGSNQGRIYRVDLDAGSATRLDVEVPGVNGLKYAASEGVVYAVTFGGDGGGQLWTITLDDEGRVQESTSRTIQEGGRFDGVVLRPNGNILVSGWGVEGDAAAPPALYRVADGGTGSVSTIELPEWQGPADFVCSQSYGCWIPDLPASVVKVVRPGERLE